ncbi:DNA-3-methyladenine glycosylase I [Mesohalobacter halotolerans]|uniref:DNA-3-methyladenine glycosylase I n=1 Tax=Mesohalobacter halotolerans TaxID=1883405 RepID=A0A4U5TP50_9FLAO|nr:DNA-3-methyladenine glycosylase I [Mesohalobacter halotolerans]MBS3739121.1 DNA-3-methyladenine glycosylase I [Psychroflexus sp.]TKS55857.1 DNA-3-methyladenine glycosylase I [Mesohalobacter halotolerans]
MKAKPNLTRCQWATKHSLEEHYHDTEWGVPVYDDQKLFEMLCLESAQAGLSWLTVLQKRKNYKKAFQNFDIVKVASFSDKKVEELLQDKGIIRNRLKIKAFINNANCVLDIQNKYGSLTEFLWSFVNHQPIQNAFKSSSDVPAKTEVSNIMSKDLKKNGFKFLGSTTCYAFMQAVGMVNDHTTNCFRYKVIKSLNLHP